MTGKIQTGHGIRCESLMMVKKKLYRFKIDDCSSSVNVLGTLANDNKT